VRVEVTNRPWVGQATLNGAAAADAVPGDESSHVGSGTGLVGLTERVSLVGGQLLSEPLAGGGFRLKVSLPWSHPGTAEEMSA
jgi:glucose-6-phosphate-specific signal transduction histidine kinase